MRIFSSQQLPSLHQDGNNNGVRIVNFAPSKNLVFRTTMFLHWNIHKYTWTSTDGKTHDQFNRILIGDDIRVYWMC
jgi:ribosomal protein S17